MPRPKLSNLSIAQLKAEITKRLASLPALIKQRDELDRRIAELQGTAPTEAPVPKKRGRKPGRRPKAQPRRRKPLADYVRDALASAPKGLSIADIEHKVLAAGYRTKSDRLDKPIGAVLRKGGFKRIGPGVYKVMGKPGRKPKTQAAPTAPAPKKPGRKPKVEAPAAKPAKRPRKRGVFQQTAQEFVLGLLKGGRTMSNRDIQAAWTKEGRGQGAPVVLSRLTKAGTLKRERIPGERGNRYSLV